MPSGSLMQCIYKEPEKSTQAKLKFLLEQLKNEIFKQRIGIAEKS